MEGGPQEDRRRRRLVARAAPTTCCRCSWPRPSASTPRTSATSTYDGGGELLPALLGNKIAFGASGFGEFLDQVKAGDVRVLAVTSEKPIDALKDVPTLKEPGIDLVFTNWRGIVAPPGISDADKKVWIDALTQDARLARRGRTS